MPGKITRIDTGETETGAQNEQLPPVVHPGGQEAPAEEAPAQE